MAIARPFAGPARSRPVSVFQRLILMVLMILLALPVAAVAAPLQRLAGQTMGTTWSVTLQASQDVLPVVRDGVQTELDRVVAQMSTWEADSDLSRYNRAPVGSAHALPAELREVLDAALQLAADSNGAFDPTVGPLVNLWGFGPDGEPTRVPDAQALAAARARTGWQRLRFDPQGRLLQPGQAYLDLSAIAKGYAVDQVARHLLARGITTFLVEVGGEMRGHGRKRGGQPWRVAVERPAPDDARDDDIEAIVALDGLAMATSGDYRHFFDDGGHRYSHTIDPRTGAPVDHRLASVTVLHESCMQADALATALTVLGPDAAWEFAQRHGLAVLLVEHDGDAFSARMTPTFAARLSAP